jgi:hypothetical protein
MVDNYEDLNDGVDVAIRSYDALIKEKNPEIYRQKLRSLGQCLEAMKERINERSNNPSEQC